MYLVLKCRFPTDDFYSYLITNHHFWLHLQQPEVVTGSQNTEDDQHLKSNVRLSTLQNMNLFIFYYIFCNFYLKCEYDKSAHHK